MLNATPNSGTGAPFSPRAGIKLSIYKQIPTAALTIRAAIDFCHQGREPAAIRPRHGSLDRGDNSRAAVIPPSMVPHAFIIKYNPRPSHRHASDTFRVHRLLFRAYDCAYS